MSFRKLTLKNFQQHHKLTIEFDLHVTTIVGASGKGKTGVFRAIDIICLNRTRGKSFIRNRRGITRVVLETEDQTITRCVGRGRNEYYVGDKRYVSFGSGKVPAPVEREVRVSPINFQRQLDPVFLFSESAGRVSQRINQVIDLAAVDAALADITGRVRSAQRELDRQSEVKTDAEKEAERYRQLEGLLTDFTELAETKEQYEKESLKTARSGLRIERAEKLRLKRLPLSEAKFEAKELTLLAERLTTLYESNARLKEAIELDREYDELRLLLDDTEQMTKFRSNADLFAKQNHDLFIRLTEAANIRGQLCGIRKTIQEAKSRLSTLAKGRCPVCGTRNVTLS